MSIRCKKTIIIIIKCISTSNTSHSSSPTFHFCSSIDFRHTQTRRVFCGRARPSGDCRAVSRGVGGDHREGIEGGPCQDASTSTHSNQSMKYFSNFKYNNYLFFYSAIPTALLLVALCSIIIIKKSLKLR